MQFVFLDRAGSYRYIRTVLHAFMYRFCTGTGTRTVTRVVVLQLLCLRDKKQRSKHAEASGLEPACSYSVTRWI
jgi:hypothetical protein